VPKAAKSLFILMAYDLLRVMGHMTALELSPWRGRAWSHMARGSVGAHSCGEARSRAEEHVVAPELTSTVRRGLKLRDTWQC
jgi:hypothetical protein